VPQNQKGFTVIELIVVMVIVGVLSAVSVASLQNIGGTQAREAAVELKSALRYCQQQAIQTQNFCAVVFDTGASNNALFYHNSSGETGSWNRMPHPVTNGNYDLEFNDAPFKDVDLFTTNVGNTFSNILVIDNEGTTRDYTGVAPSSSFTSVATIEFNSGAHTVNIAPETGHISIT
jgi:prepilin-type N-terminal cleavage/methylation domain-containing protein